MLKYGDDKKQILFDSCVLCMFALQEKYLSVDYIEVLDIYYHWIQKRRRHDSFTAVCACVVCAC